MSASLVGSEMCIRDSSRTVSLQTSQICWGAKDATVAREQYLVVPRPAGTELPKMSMKTGEVGGPL
eukprot:4263719-Alexandrium_andersonii.AAC.1